MKNSKRKINWGLIIYPSVGIIIGGVGAVTYIAITKLMNDGPRGINFKIFKRSQGESTWFDFNGKEIEPSDATNQLKAIRFKVVENDSENSFISNDVLKMVAKKFIERGIFGPELGSLKTISFDDKNLISGKNVNGIYIPSTKEIGINTESINNSLSNHFKKYKRTEELHNLFKEIKSEEIFQVLYHEYGHHIFSSYAESPYTGKVKTIYEKNLDKVKETWKVRESKWNNLFLEKFMKLFSYDDSKSLPLDSGYLALQIRGLPTIGSEFTAHDLFKEINLNKDLPNDSVIDWNKEYLNLSSQIINYFRSIPVDLDTYKMSIKEEYSYLYSAEELVTRKLLLASAPFSKEAFDASKKIQILPYDLISDFSNFTSVIPSAFFSQNVHPALNRIFMNDYLFSNDNRAEKYMKLLDETMGHKENNNISFIWNMNNSLVAKVNNDSGVMPKKNERSESSDPNKIKFGGYTDKQYNYIGYMDGNKFVPFKIKTYKFKIGYKNSVLSGFVDKTSTDLREKIKYYKKDASGNMIFDNSLSKLPYSYYLEQWVDANDIKNQVLYFADDQNGTNKKLLSGVRSENQGGTTTFSKWSRYELGQPDSSIWKAKFDIETKDNEQGLMIKNGGLFKDAVSKI